MAVSGGTPLKFLIFRGPLDEKKISHREEYMSQRISLTGIKPTGVPHLGNFIGAIRPALQLSERYEARYFIADYHALNTVKDAAELRSLTYEVAAAWLACGLDPERVLLYRQSDIPETFELATVLMCFTAKGLMNRAHAYKAKVQENEANGRTPDDGINMGLYTYPVLMAADILLFNTNVVPVGHDQKQHVEMTADMAQSFNHHYGQEVLVVPEAVTTESTQSVIGLDGRKMSKSYRNTIPLFLPPKKLRKTVMKIITNSQAVEEPKDPDSCNIFRLFQLFADDAQQETLRKRYQTGGMGWGEAKEALVDIMEDVLSPLRSRYDKLMADKSYIDQVLRKGADRARPIAAETLQRIRSVCGVDVPS